MERERHTFEDMTGWLEEERFGTGGVRAVQLCSNWRPITTEVYHRSGKRRGVGSGMRSDSVIAESIRQMEGVWLQSLVQER